MTPTRQGSMHLFRLWGVEVYLHYSWFFVAIYSISTRIHKYEAPVWGAWEYLALFLIVLLHEFGHALACRQVGGKADQIVLWPLGGIAYGTPPARPGATLWTIAAGPLVNVVLVPVLYGLLYIDQQAGWAVKNPDMDTLVVTIGLINRYILYFNLLPVYPLDGGQILQALLWYPLGRARSLLVATMVGFLGVGVLAALVFWFGIIRIEPIWFAAIAFFLLSNSWRSFQHARALIKIEKLPRRPEFACPVCRSSPPLGNYWRCKQCSQPFDAFATGAVCPQCGATHEVTTCPDCGEARALRSWDKSIIDA